MVRIKKMISILLSLIMIFSAVSIIPVSASEVALAASGM